MIECTTCGVTRPNKFFIIKEIKRGDLPECRKCRRKKWKRRNNELKDKNLYSDIDYTTRNARMMLYYAIKKDRYDELSEKYIGCNLESFKEYIEAQFEDGMNWDNYGEWELDHIKPLASAKNPKEILILTHYTNLQPLWASENRSKRHKLIEKQLRLI